MPLYHDMGLIINALQSLYVGSACVLMTPVAFVQRPLVWLRAISDYRAEVAGGPNFAFDLCVDRYRPEQMDGIDLSGWKVAFNGAEPVRAESIRRFCETYAPHGFAASAMLPAYGLAEATVLVSAGRRGAGAVTRTVSRDGAARRPRRAAATIAEDAQAIVGCGRAIGDERIAIVDPDSRVRLGAGQIGEIWVAGPNVARGYWRNPEASAAAFGAQHRRRGAAATGCAPAISAFSIDSGELYITGRIKDVIIIRGANHYPQDIEDTVQAGASGAAPARRRGLCGAGRRRRGTARRRAGGRAHLAPPHRHRRDRRAHSRGGRHRARDRAVRDRAAAAGRIAENDQRQDPADVEPQTMAGGIAGRL